MQRIKNLFFLILGASYSFMGATTLLIKIPTRSRPHQFFKTVDKFYQHLSFTIDYKFLISCDLDDPTMNNPQVIKRLQNYPNLEFSFHDNKSKVEAFNKDLDTQEFDILLVAHDDMEPVVRGFDRIIVTTMTEHFPDLDGVLNFHDGFVGGQCNTLPVIGKKFYRRFGYLYHPDYKALVCNVELTLISKILRKEKVVDQVIIKHNHPAWGAGKHDDLYTKSEQYHQQDLETFIKRRALFFNLSQDQIAQATPKLWSILICTIEGREQSFTALCEKLKKQSDALGLHDQIEILAFKDKKGEHTIGYKRNSLLAQSQGKYISFIDDDDDVHDDFIKLITTKLLENPDCTSYDCTSLTGIITVNGNHAKKFIHSLRYTSYFEHNNVYFRPPNHLNPMKRAVAIQFSFPEKNFGEDTQWAMAIAQSGLLQREAVIDTPYYFYLYRDK